MLEMSDTDLFNAYVFRMYKYCRTAEGLKLNRLAMWKALLLVNGNKPDFIIDVKSIDEKIDKFKNTPELASNLLRYVKMGFVSQSARVTEISPKEKFVHDDGLSDEPSDRKLWFYSGTVLNLKEIIADCEYSTEIEKSPLKVSSKLQAEACLKLIEDNVFEFYLDDSKYHQEYPFKTTSRDANMCINKGI